MILPEKLSMTAALAIGATALAAYLVTLFNAGQLGTAGAGAETQVAAATAPSLVQTVEGGIQTGGYIDGRPVPSGFTMPVVIRYRASNDEAAPPQPAEKPKLTGR